MLYKVNPCAFKERRQRIQNFVTFESLNYRQTAAKDK